MATAAELQARDKVFIGGEWVEPQATETLEVINSSTEEVIGTIPACTPADADRAVLAAREAFESWSQTPREERAGYLAAIAAGLGERSEEIAATISQELGMPLKLSQLIQAGPAHRPVRGDAGADGGSRLGGGDRQLAGPARAGRRARRDHPLELPAQPDRRQGRPRPRRRLHRGAQAERGRRRSTPSSSPRSSRRPACPPASSTWSPAPGPRSARRSPAIPASTWSPSPARPGRAGASPSSPRRRSSRWRWSSAASRRT